MHSRRILLAALCAGILLATTVGTYVLWKKSEPLNPVITSSPETASATSDDAADATPSGMHRSAVKSLSPGAQALADAAVASAKLEAEKFMATSGRADPMNDALLKKGEVQQQELRAEAGRRAVEDPKAALAWALTQGDNARLALDAVLDVVTTKDPAATFQEFRWLQAGDGLDLRGYGLSVIVERWAGANPAVAASAVATLPPSPGNAHFMARVLSSWSETDARGAAERLKSLASAERGGAGMGLTESTFASVGGRLAGQDPTWATQWALGFAEGTSERAYAVAGVVAGWYDKDAKAVSAWLDGMEDAAAHDAGAAALVQFSVRTAPEIAMQWAETITNNKQRSILTVQVAANWLTSDPEKAEAWLKKSEVVTAEEREMILTNSRLARSVGDVIQSK